jgi:hypothetical protein
MLFNGKLVLAAVGTLALVAGLAQLHSPVAGGEVTCGWCWDFEPEGHHFPDGGDLCGWPPGEECSRCGGTSGCHTEFDNHGPCHIECGPGGGDFAALTRELDPLVSAGNLDGIRALAERIQGKYLIRSTGEAGVLEVVAVCNPDEVGATYAIDPSADLRAFASLDDD